MTKHTPQPGELPQKEGWRERFEKCFLGCDREECGNGSLCSRHQFKSAAEGHLPELIIAFIASVEEEARREERERRNNELILEMVACEEAGWDFTRFINTFCALHGPPKSH